MILDLRRSTGIVVAPGFHPGASRTRGRHAANGPVLHCDNDGKYRRTIWQGSFILGCFRPVHMILNKVQFNSIFGEKWARLGVGSWWAAADVGPPALGILPKVYTK